MACNPRNEIRNRGEWHEAHHGPVHTSYVVSAAAAADAPAAAASDSARCAAKPTSICVIAAAIFPACTTFAARASSAAAARASFAAAAAAAIAPEGFWDMGSLQEGHGEQALESTPIMAYLLVNPHIRAHIQFVDVGRVLVVNHPRTLG
jgi:hypothetical protein